MLNKIKLKKIVSQTNILNTQILKFSEAINLPFLIEWINVSGMSDAKLEFRLFDTALIRGQMFSTSIVIR